MSEWYNSQKKPSVDFRKSLQKLIDKDKANPFRFELTKEDQQQLENLNIRWPPVKSFDFSKTTL